MNVYINEALALEAYSESIHEFDLAALQAVQEFTITSIPMTMTPAIVGQSVDRNTTLLLQGVEQLNMVSVDRTKLINFFENIYNSDELFTTPLTTPLKSVTEIEDVRPNYLDSFIDAMNVTVGLIAKGQITKDTLKQKYLNPIYSASMKRKLVKTSLSELDYKILIKSANREVPCAVTEEFFTAKVLPFLRTFQEDAKEMTIDTQKLINAMKRGNEQIKTFMDVYNTGNTSIPQSTAVVMSYYLFNITRMFMDLCSYTTYMLMRKMNAFAYNVHALINLYEKILSFYPENNAHFHESVLDGMLDDVEDVKTMSNLLDGDSSVLQQVVRRIYDSHQFGVTSAADRTLGDKFHSVMDLPTENSQNYDLSPYVNLESVMTSIIKSIFTIEANCKDGSMTIDDLKQKSGLDIPLAQRFSSCITGISDITVYTEVENSEENSVIYRTIIEELKAFPTEIEKFANYVRDIYQYANNLDDKIHANINNEFDPTDLLADTRKFVIDFNSDFRDLVTQIVQGLLRRLRSLDDFLTHLETPETDPDTEQQMDTSLIEDNNDFVKEAVISELEDDELYYAYRQMVENARHQIRSIEHTYGVQLFTEADDSQNNGGTTSGGSESSGSSSSGNDGGNKSGNKKEGTPEVTGSGEGSEDTNKNNNEENKDGNKEGSDKKKFNLSELIKKMAEFFDTILKKFMDAIDKQLGINKKWLASHKDELLGKKIRNREIKNIYPYADDMPEYVVENIRACVSAVNGLSKEKLADMDNNAIDKLLFGFITIAADIPIRDKMTQWYTTKDKEMKPTILKNGEIEKRFSPMIEYCELFYDKLANDVSNALKDLKNAWNAKAKTLEGADSAKILYINKQIKYYAGTVLNCVRDRNYSYLKVMKTFVGKSNNENNNQENNDNKGGSDSDGEGSNGTSSSDGENS